MVNNPHANAEDTEKQVRPLTWKDPLEQENGTHSSIFAWEIPWTEETGGLQSVGSQRAGQNEHTHTHTHTHINLHLLGPTLWNNMSSEIVHYDYLLLIQNSC